MEACRLNIFAFALFAVISLRTTGQCTPPGGVPVVACGTGTPLTDNVTISSGIFSAVSGSFSGVNVDGGTLVLCGTVTIINFNLHTGSVVINPGASATFNGNFNTNGGGFYNLGSTTFNTDVSLQGPEAFCYTDAAASTTVNGMLAVFNTGTFYHNGMAVAIISISMARPGNRGPFPS